MIHSLRIHIIFISIIRSCYGFKHHILYIEENLISDTDEPVIESDLSMNGVNKDSVTGITASKVFGRIIENDSKEPSMDEEECRDTVALNDTFPSSDKEAKKNRERFAITKSYSIEVSQAIY